MTLYDTAEDGLFVDDLAARQRQSAAGHPDGNAETCWEALSTSIIERLPSPIYCR
jgi:hypothetical protein